MPPDDVECTARWAVCSTALAHRGAPHPTTREAAAHPSHMISSLINSRNMIVKIKKNKITTLKVSGNPIKIKGYKDLKYRNDAPELNQDKERILKEFNIKEL